MKKLSLFLLFLFIVHITCFAVKFSFAVFGDNRDGDEVFMDLIKKMNTDAGIEFAVNTGDMTSRGSADEYEKYRNMAGDSRVKIYDVAGNHDLGFLGMGSRIFSKKYGATYYYFDYDDSRFIIIDNAKDKGIGRKQWKWLEKALDTDRSVFVFMHKPLFDATGSYPDHVMKPEKESRNLDDLLKSSKVKYVFAGHIHGYGRLKAGGVTYIITAGAGAPLYLPAFSGGFYHYVKVTVDDSKVKDEVVKIYD